MLDKLQIIISIIAGIIFTIVMIVGDGSFNLWLKNIVLILILFYFIGLAVRNYFRKKIFVDDETKLDDQTIENDDDGNDIDDHESSTNILGLDFDEKDNFND